MSSALFTAAIQIAIRLVNIMLVNFCICVYFGWFEAKFNYMQKRKVNVL